ncbi:hypothetical protein HY947_00480 [Candidatus Gottesmanbacteria bacterium]|nr:hypothetical protein [Candidatus Gottesmanbacteria bacterium]
MKKYILGAVASTVIGFATAFVWHLVLFQNLYTQLGVIGRIEPNIPLGFIANLALALTLSYLYPKLISSEENNNPILGGIRFGVIIGILNIIFWVLKFAATQPLSSIPTFIGIESAFELIQPTLIGIELGFVYRKRI